MLDDIDRLRTSEGLRLLLSHYGRIAEPNRDAWQDRLMAIDGIEPATLTKLHGLLIAMDWIELRTGHVGAGSAAAQYRVTRAGLRALRLADRPDPDEEACVQVMQPDDAATPGSARLEQDELPVIESAAA